MYVNDSRVELGHLCCLMAIWRQVSRIAILSVVIISIRPLLLDIDCKFF